MKLVYAADLHGDTAAYEALGELAVDETAAAVLLGGDLFAYHERAAPQIDFAEGPLRRFLEGLSGASIEVLAIGGNVDRPGALAHLGEFEHDGLIRIVGTQPHRLAPPEEPTGGIDVVGYPRVPPTPFRLKDHERRDLAMDRYSGPWPIWVTFIDPDAAPMEASADTLDRLLSIEEELAVISPTEQPCVLMAHSPPWGGNLDRLRDGGHHGSHAIRRWIEDRQPLLSLHGHLHEAPDVSGQWAEAIGRTICVNPGPAGGPTLQAVLLETADLPGSLRHTARRPSGLTRGSSGVCPDAGDP